VKIKFTDANGSALFVAGCSNRPIRRARGAAEGHPSATTPRQEPRRAAGGARLGEM
jgi:hypothetical protein